MKAPFPWFGGKRRVADVVWRAFGPTINNYVEPFAGSLAVLLGRPGGAGKIETVNDLNCDIANFWRAVAADPAAVAEAADWPVNEADLHARHVELVTSLPAHRERMHTDPKYFDAPRAGLWVWGICQWIGGGWCAEPNNRKHPKLDGIGKGVHSNAGHYGRRPQLSSAGQGVHLPARQRPHLSVTEGNDRGLNGVAAAPCVDWFRQLQTRLRRVRVACGDWTRVLGPSVLGKGKNVGGRRPCAVFLDPPYSHDVRDKGLYSEDAAGLSDAVRTWALEHGDDPDLRIALCGYEGEHEMPSAWTEYSWTAARGYAGAANENRQRERIWFSPHCLPLEAQRQLFVVQEARR